MVTNVYPDYTGTTADGVHSLTSEAIAVADELVNAAIADSDRTFVGTMQPLEEAATLMADAYGRGAFLARVHTDEKVRTAAIEEEERITKWGTELVFRTDLFNAVRAFADTAEADTLDPVRRRLLDHWLRDLRRAGHNLDDDARRRLRELSSRLVELEVEFSKNLDSWDDGLDLTRDELDGLPDSYVEALRPGTQPGTHYVSMDYPDYTPFMQQSRRRDLRETMQRKFWNRAADANLPLLAEAVALRQAAAELLGDPSWGHHAMEVKMAGSPDAVAELYDTIMPALEIKVAEELTRMRADFAADHPGEELQSWDWMFYHDRQRHRDFGIDANQVAEYFSLEDVVAGMFEITGEVFGLEYRRIDNPPAWHRDVALYEICDAGADEARAYFFADLFPRVGKFGHAAAFPIVYGRTLPDGAYRKPVAAIVANFTKPSAERPSLLRHNEALTLFHEFGHILHFCLSTVPLIRFSGFDTEWDFVEAPSQIMEHWMWRPEVLQRFARHHETGEPIPTDLVERLVAARDLNVALHTARQVYLGQVDLMLHDGRPEVDLDEINRIAFAFTQLPYPEGTNFLASFGHLMGGYDAGYYGYLWAKVYGDDMFSVFQDEGVLSPRVGARYRREVLERGGSRDAIDHLRAFLGREPSTDAFLRNIGIGAGTSTSD